ncbi:MAG: TA system VapC family ribonuclease toxin [Actinomycetota bacterium]
MFLVDTNVLLYAANQAAPEHPPCASSLQRWREQATPWHVTWGILYEFLRVSTHQHVFSSPLTPAEAWSFVGSVLAAPALGVLIATPRHADVLTELTEIVPQLTGNLWHDAHTAVLMKEHGIRQIVTRDTHFHRFPFLEVIDPLS